MQCATPVGVWSSFSAMASCCASMVQPTRSGRFSGSSRTSRRPDCRRHMPASPQASWSPATAYVYGQTVNLAARIAGQAGPGQIVVDEGAVIALPAGIARIAPLGRVTLKGIPGEVGLWLATPAVGRSLTPTRRERKITGDGAS